ncbi:MAG: Bro-N domain-containing protein, partial [Candidatus Fonsibacter sp.]
FNNTTITCSVVNGDPWFKAREVATILGYTNTTQAIIKNVDKDDKQTYAKILETLQINNLSERQLEANGNKKTLYLSTNQVCIASSSESEKQEAKAFKKWVCSEVLPSIKKHSNKMLLMDGDISDRSLSFASAYGEITYINNKNTGAP